VGEDFEKLVQGERTDLAPNGAISTTQYRSSARPTPVSQAKASKLMKLSSRGVQRAAKVIAEAPSELVQAVELGVRALP
jgi:hypothetical protein